ncbi:MAG: GntR family transcriptional regulator, partial [Chloroflexi bacterium]|nr:GntR family transcriptional regulator [Chloroflexota bacterium]
MLLKIDPSSPVPINEQIAQWMRQNILSGKWPRNQKLQSESDLAANLKVSRGTIRKAIETLIDERL